MQRLFSGREFRQREQDDEDAERREVGKLTAADHGHDHRRYNHRAESTTALEKPMTEAEVAYLFSYGTLRQREVQLAVFGRELDSAPDALPGFNLGQVRITDPAVIEKSGSDLHPILNRTDDPGQAVEGVALSISPDDVVAADAYEVSDYKRVTITLASGRRAYAYVSREDG